MNNVEHIDWEQVENFVERVYSIAELNNRKFSGVYGLPRGGLVLAVM